MLFNSLNSYLLAALDCYLVVAKGLKNLAPLLFAVMYIEAVELFVAL